jgi:hypothetical protein
MLASIKNGQVISPTKSSLVWALPITLISAEFDGESELDAEERQILENSGVVFSKQQNIFKQTGSMLDSTGRYSVIVVAYKYKDDRISFCLKDDQQGWETPNYISLIDLNFNDIVLSYQRWLLNNIICDLNDVTNTYRNVLRLMVR